MTYEPPEWRGRGPRDREGWPNRTFDQTPGGPRSHRGGPGQVRVPLTREEDTGEFRPSREPYGHDAPTEEFGREVPIGETPFGPPPARRPVIKPHFTLEREPDPLVRLNQWLGLGVKILGIVALVCVIWLLGMCLRDGGVPLWVPRS